MNFQKLIVRGRLLLLALFFFAFITSTQAQNDVVQVKLSRDPDSITIFIPAVNGSVSLKGFVIESPDLSMGLNARRGIAFDQVSGFAGLNFDSLPTPICLRLLRVNAQIPVPIDCNPGQVATFVALLEDGSIFWHNNNVGPLNIIVRLDDGDGDISNDTQIALCPSGTALCNFTIPVAVGPTPTPLPEVLGDRIAAQAVESFKAGSYTDAANEATQYIQLQPDDAFGYLLRALAKVFIKSYDEALQDYNQALSIESNLKYHAYLGRGNVYLDLNNPQAAIEDFTSAIEIQPTSGIPHYLRARAYETIQQYDAAIQDFQAARDKGMNSALVLVELGRMYFEQGDLTNALASFDAAVANNPSSVPAYSGRSAVHRALGNTQQAIDDATRALQPPATAAPSVTTTPSLEITVDNVINVFTVAISIDSGVDTAGIYCDRGAMYLDNMDYTAAITDFENARMKDAQSICAFTGLAIAYSYTGNREQVSEYISAALFLEPSDAVTYNTLGAAYMNINDYENAVVSFSQAIERDPSAAIYYSNRATAYLNLDQYQTAVDDYLKALELGDMQDNTFYNLGVAYVKLGNTSGAIENFTQAITINAKPTYYFGRGNAYLNSDEYQLALQDYDQAIALGYTDMGIYFNRGVAFFNQGNYPTAAENFTQAINLGMDSSDVYYNRGLSNYNLGQFENAAIDFRAAVERDPSTAQYHYNLADALIRVNPSDCNAVPPLREYLRLAGAEARPEAQNALTQLEPSCG
jgi:tetratricopeptide (TPR) repeat protein